MWLEYGLNEAQNLISISEVTRGKTALKCPYCQGELIAKKGKIKVHHFAHAGETCEPSQNQNIHLPLFCRFNLVLNNNYLEHFRRIASPDYKCTGLRKERKIIRYLQEKEILEHKLFPTLSPLGKAILKQLTLSEFCEAQDKMAQDKLIELQNKVVSLERSIKDTIKFQTTDYYQSRPIRYHRKVEKNQRLKEEELKNAKIDFHLYCIHYRGVLLSHLYFLLIETPSQTLFKIGVTSRDIDSRLSEIKIDLGKIFPDFSITLLGFWEHRGNLEYYFKYLYEEFNYPLENFTEYFNFSDIEPIKNSLNSLGYKQLSALEQEVINGNINNYKSSSNNSLNSS
ncbi:hypothetical protein cce_4921 [Crocosphaera subtropica ATCC 51142]|uniref:Competence protein CoiA-like N-terminal domain-containing protein n=1 Tax=Crocosphaera subtropica (strain ATCC 51142 / BH68) TaxID=43989 RepID=B1X2A6_CROS5|nr:competence protein CoiA family protein [Crocosphaera subtropica]ACB54267.1 hypothetical protein cce_4921 [Crocosphaera subtropica ATCC 51142]